MLVANEMRIPYLRLSVKIEVITEARKANTNGKGISKDIDPALLCLFIDKKKNLKRKKTKSRTHICP